MRQLRRHGLPERGGARLARAAHRPPQPPRRRRPHRARPRQHRRRTPAPPAGPPRIGAASRRGQGRLGDPEVEVAAEDARDLAAGLARGEQKLFRVGLYLTVHARTEEQLEAECARVRSVCASMLLDAQPATWRMLQGWTSTLPVGVDAARPTTLLRHRRPGRVVPVRLGRAVRHHRRPLRHHHQRVGAGAVGPLRPGQPQLGHPRPLRRRQVLPGQARSAALPVRGDRDRGRRPRGRVPPPGRDRRRRLRPPRRPRRAGQPLRPRPRPRRARPAGPCSSTPSSPSCSAASPTRRQPRRSTGGSSPPTSRSGSRRTPAATPDPHRCSETWPPRWTPMATLQRGRWPPGWHRT